MSMISILLTKRYRWWRRGGSKDRRI